ncbi:MAG: hypothetical protein Q8Q23_00015, partial [bacterium]|nr:hypothetical protein [bacterium]
YLKLNKNKYSETALVEALKKAGYKSSDILESMTEVFGKDEVKTTGGKVSFWNFREKREYTRGSEKFLDFFFAILVSVLAYFIIRSFFIGFFLQIVGVASAFIFTKRRFIGYGFITSIVVAPIIFLVILIILWISGFHSVEYIYEDMFEDIIYMIF